MVFDYSHLSVSWLSASGIAWDISGAVALSKGVFFVSDDKLRRHAGSYWGSNPSAVRGFCEQRFDTRFGLSQLLLGFMLQACSALGITVDVGGALLLMAPILFSWGIYVSHYDYWVVSTSLRMRKGNEGSEAVWRQHFPDVSYRTWHAVLLNDDVIFEEDERRKANSLANTGE